MKKEQHKPSKVVKILAVLWLTFVFIMFFIIALRGVDFAPLWIAVPLSAVSAIGWVLFTHLALEIISYL